MDKDGGKDGKEKKEKKHAEPIFSCLEFTPDGSDLLVGHWSGLITVVDPLNGAYRKLSQSLTTSENNNGRGLSQLVVSSDGKYFATCDLNNCISLFKKDHLHGDPSNPIEW